jgi:hypothetical protein
VLQDEIVHAEHGGQKVVAVSVFGQYSFEGNYDGACLRGARLNRNGNAVFRIMKDYKGRCGCFIKGYALNGKAIAGFFHVISQYNTGMVKIMLY